ncbi:MAG: hypothetical protein KAR20_18850, partial [Candidatus Heimdallarchaeota archaeon]|nr:hypothetical protein [Candidatus Heimdallarchaeota archaeon]
DNYGQTPLANAAFFGRLEVIEFLVGCGADAKTRDDHGQTPASCAVRGERLEIAAFLEEVIEKRRRVGAATKSAASR